MDSREPGSSPKWSWRNIATAGRSTGRGGFGAGAGILGGGLGAGAGLLTGINAASLINLALGGLTGMLGLPFELCGYYGNRCGPDVAEWFFVEILLHRNYVIRNVLYLRNFFRSFERYALTIPHKWRHFNTTNCPKGCSTESVTLCDKCIDNSELGNIIFGMAVRMHKAFNKWEDVEELVKFWRVGFGDEWSTAAGRLGYYSITPWDIIEGETLVPKPVFGNPKEMCEFMTNFPSWKKIQAPEHKDCSLCTEPFKGPHTVPGMVLGTLTLTPEQIEGLRRRTFGQ